MLGEQSTTQQLDAKPDSPASPRASLPLRMKLALLLLSVVFSLAVFLTLDGIRSSAILRHANSAKASTCRVADPVLHHALKPNCAFIEHWGHDNFAYFTNSLGLRDQKIRDVPLADGRPRILILGNSFTEGETSWQDSFVGQIAAQLPQYDFLNGGAPSYSPSNYLNLTRKLLAKGVDIDEVIVFSGVFDVFNEASFYRDVDANGAVAGPKQQRWNIPRYAKARFFIARNFMLTNYAIEAVERLLIGHGYYHLYTDQFGDAFDMEATAWTYRNVDETDPHPAGYAPLGAEAGIAKEKAKMTLLWQELQKRNIPISVVVYPYPAQLVHDSAESRQVRLWRDWCEGKCKSFISVFPAFFAVKEQCPPSRPGCWYLSHFIFGDFHYNRAGNTVVADAVINNLEQHPPAKLPQPDSTPATQARAESSQALGLH
jgi:hypothetical protein